MKQSAILLNTQYEFEDTLTLTADEIGDDHIMTTVETPMHADAFVINISSPNTIGLRDLQSEDALKQLLDKTLRTYRQKNAGFSRPILLKDRLTS